MISTVLVETVIKSNVALKVFQILKILNTIIYYSKYVKFRIHSIFSLFFSKVYDKEKASQILSKEVIHFNIQSLIINETTLGLEVIENQVTPFTFSNFDIAGIDSNRQYLVYKIIKPLEKNQGQLEHSSKPGVPVEIFTQNDLNRGFVLYHSPREIGIYPKDFAFTFIGMCKQNKFFSTHLTIS
jgi:hypothetical protein